MEVLRVVLRVCLRLFEGCFEVVWNVALGFVLRCCNLRMF